MTGSHSPPRASGHDPDPSIRPIGLALTEAAESLAFLAELDAGMREALEAREQLGPGGLVPLHEAWASGTAAMLAKLMQPCDEATLRERFRAISRKVPTL